MATRKPKRTPPQPRKRSVSRRDKASHEPGTPSNTPASIPHPVPIVGIGASAGGFEALKEFFKTIPPEPNMAFIVVQHLDPTRVSEMPAILGRQTGLKVVLAEEGCPIEPNVVYTIPPDRYVTVEAGRIRIVMPAEPRGHRLPVDALFYSLGKDAAERAVGVILSGNGADGSLGLRAIKNHGGMAIVQDPVTAEYDGMPRNAIATGAVDLILKPARMMEAIFRYIKHDYVQKPGHGEGPLPDYVADILALLHARLKVDFSGYKKATLVRRIERRMGLRHLASGQEYLRLLGEDSNEINTLFNDLLIQVTRFFREPASWALLESEVLTRLVADGDTDRPIRAWVPACATGEEAYSIAILLLELAEKAHKPVPIQVFASDLDPAALSQARAGSYPESIAADVTPERLARFFVSGEHRYTVSQALRDSVVFAHHNVVTDPPFSRLDLISCRNMLIYLEPTMQRRLISLFHFALKPGGYLFLGNSESVGPDTGLFEPVSKRVRVYRRLGSGRPLHPRLSMVVPSPAPFTSIAIATPASGDAPAMARARELVLERYTAASALINRRMEILSLFGPTEEFLSQPSGTLTPNILSWVREGIRSKLRMAIQAAIRKGQEVTVGGLKTRRVNAPGRVALTVQPLSPRPESDGLLLVVFSHEKAVSRPARVRRPRAAEESQVQHLENELKILRDDLQASVDQLENSNEGLLATNEEILSMNEELQSTNEELETSQEELQSVNEELSAVNSQLECKVEELQAVTNDISNLLTSTDLPALFLDRQFLIRRYTPAISRLFRLIPSDDGRRLEDIATVVNDPTLLADAREVLRSLTPSEREVSTQDGQGYLRRVLPYRTDDDRIEGVVITYTDLSERIRADQATREARDFAEAIVETLREPLLVLDQGQVVRSANTAFYRVFRLGPEKVLGRRIYDVGEREWDIPELRHLLTAMLPEQGQIQNLEVRREFAGVGELVICVNARTLEMAGQRVILLALEDITHRIEAERTRTLVLRQLIGAEEKERHRLALELHDETGQHVTAFLLGLATLRHAHATQPESRALIDELTVRAEELARHLHGIALQLRPTALDDHGLERALSNYVEDISLRYGLEIDLHTGKRAARLPPHIETVLYRVTQEALTNVLKHARSTKASVILARKPKEVSLIIEDNGGGFDTERFLGDDDQAHLGLRGMRERVTLAGGTLTIESRPEAGTTLFARIPLSSDGHANAADDSEG